MVEYVRFLGPESIYGQKHLLHGELGLLEIVKRIRNYSKLRQEELVLRVALKKRFDEALENLELLDKLLPHDKLSGLMKRKSRPEGELAEEKENLSLEQELEVIRRRLEKLEV